MFAQMHKYQSAQISNDTIVQTSND